MKMTRYHLTITIYNPFFDKKLTSRDKVNSVWFADYSFFMDKIIHELDESDLNKFRLNLFNCFKDEISWVRTSQYIDGTIFDGYSIVSQDFDCSSNVIAFCLPNRKVRDKYFQYDCFRERYFVKSDFISCLKN